MAVRRAHVTTIYKSTLATDLADRVETTHIVIMLC